MVKQSIYKRSILLIAAIFLLVSACSYYDVDIIGDGSSMDATKTAHFKQKEISYSVSLNDARRFSELRHPGRGYSIDTYTVQEDTTLYVFNYDDGGWLVISGDKRIEPLIAESHKDNIDIRDEATHVRYIRSIGDKIAQVDDDWFPEENALSLWDKISPSFSLVEEKNPETKSLPCKWVIRRFFMEENTTYSNEVSHLLATKWGQEEPWNASMPIYEPCTYCIGAGLPPSHHCTAGCMAVAIAQVLYYYNGHVLHKPNALYESIRCNPSTQSYTSNIGVQLGTRVQLSSRWSDMPLDCYAIDGHYDYVSDFLLEVGHWCNMKYSCVNAPIPAERGSGTTVSAAYSGIWDRYGISCRADDYSINEIDEDLRNGNPVIISVNPQNVTQDSFGHTWVIDGLQYERQDYTMVRYCEYTNEWTSADEVYDSFEEVQRRYGFTGEYDFQTYLGDPIILKHWFMNWGCDGRGDDVTYASNPFWNNPDSGSSVYLNDVVLICHDFE